MFFFMDGWFNNWLDANNKPLKSKETTYGDAVLFVTIIILTIGWLREWLLRRGKGQVESESKAPVVPSRYHVEGRRNVENHHPEVFGVNVMTAIMPTPSQNERPQIRLVGVRETDDFNAVLFDQNRRIHNANYG